MHKFVEAAVFAGLVMGPWLAAMRREQGGSALKNQSGQDVRPDEFGLVFSPPSLK